MVVACSADHMRQLHAQAAARHCIDAEPGAGKLLRALEVARRDNRTEISTGDLQNATGLTQEQFLAAVQLLERDDPPPRRPADQP